MDDLCSAGSLRIYSVSFFPPGTSFHWLVESSGGLGMGLVSQSESGVRPTMGVEFRGAIGPEIEDEAETEAETRTRD